jgi:hypothetical protein
MIKLNSKTLTIAGILLMVLALLYVATPLLRPVMGVSERQTVTSGQGFPAGGPGGGFQVITPNDQGGAQVQGPVTGQSDQGVIIQGSGGDTQGLPQRQFTGARPGGLLGSVGFLNGSNAIIVYAVALLISLVAAVGMLTIKNWGRILGLIMGVIYSVMALLSFLPMLLIGFMMRRSGIRIEGSLNIWLTLVHLALAIAVIVLAAISARKVAKSEVVVPPPATPA